MNYAYFVDRPDPTEHSFIKNFWMELPAAGDKAVMHTRGGRVWRFASGHWVEASGEHGVLSALFLGRGRGEWTVIVRNRSITLLLLAVLRPVLGYSLHYQVSNLHSERVLKFGRGSRLKRWLARLELASRHIVWPLLDEIHPVSDYMSNYLQSQRYASPKKYWTLPLGIADAEVISDAQDMEERPVDLIYAGTCHLSRRPDILLSALANYFSLPARRCLKVVLVFHGGTEMERREVGELASQFESGDVEVMWDLPRSRVLGLMRKSRYGISYYPDDGFEENSPTKVFEYAASGCWPLMYGVTPEQRMLAERVSALACVPYRINVIVEDLRRLPVARSREELVSLRERLLHLHGYAEMLAKYRSRSR